MDARDAFAGPFDGFIDARRAIASELKAREDAAGAKAVIAWRKPTRAAWLVNLLSRHEPDQIAEAMELGESLAEAHRSTDATQLRELTRLRTSLIARLSGRAVELGRDHAYAAPESVRGEVAETLTAGLADPEVAEAIRRGMLSRTVRASGFGPADLFAPSARIVEFPGARPAPRPAPDADDQTEDRGALLARLSEQLQRAEAAYAAVEGPAAEARAAADEALRSAHLADARRAEAQQALVLARVTLARAEEAHRSAADDAESLHRQAARTQAEGERLAVDAERVRTELDRVRAEVAAAIGLSSGPTR